MSIELNVSKRSHVTRLIVCVLVFACCCASTLGCRSFSLRDWRLHDSKSLVSARSYSLRGADSLQQRKYEDAESLFVEALRQSPNDDRAQWGYAEVLWQRGEHKQATEHMQQAVAQNSDYLVRLGQMHLEQNEYDLAMDKADTAIRTRRNDAAAWALKADVLRSSHRIDEAVTCYQRALLYRSDWPEVQLTLSELYRQSQRPQRALATLDRLCDQHPDSQLPPRVFLVRGQALADLGEREAAVMCLRNAAPKLAPDQTQLLLEFATVQYQLGDLVESRLCLGRVLQHDPNNSNAARMQNELDQLLDRPIGTRIPAVTVSNPGSPR